MPSRSGACFKARGPERQQGLAGCILLVREFSIAYSWPILSTLLNPFEKAAHSWRRVFNTRSPSGVSRYRRVPSAQLIRISLLFLR